MESFIALLAASACLALFGLAAIAFGAETRDGFTELPLVQSGGAG